MNRKAINIFKTVISTVFLITLCVPTYPKSPTTPDFAFPKEAEKEAEIQLETALKTHDPVETIRSLMNLTIASSLISQENVYDLLPRIDSIGSKLDAPYRGLTCLLEAEIYRQIYADNPYLFNRRNVVAEMADSNPGFWDKKLFSDKINSLVKLALAERNQAEKLPLMDLEPLIDFDIDMDSFTVYDFFVYKSLELVEGFSESNVIPFYKSSAPSDSPLVLLDQLLELHPDSSRAHTQAVLKKASLLGQKEGMDLVWESILQNSDTPELNTLALYYYEMYLSRNLNASDSIKYPENYRQFYDLINKVHASVPESKEKTELGKLLSVLGASSVNLSFTNKATTYEPVEVEATVSNINQFYLILAEVNNPKENNFAVSLIEKYARIIETQPVILSGTVPFRNIYKATFDIKKPGCYVVIASSTPKLNGIITEQKYFYPTFITVSDIDAFAMNQVVPREMENKNNLSNLSGCFVVDSREGKPLSGVKVKFEKQEYIKGQTKKTSENAVTDSNGYASSPFPHSDASVNFKGNLATTWVNQYYESPQKEVDRIVMFTDRSVYRPGDVLRFLGIDFHQGNNRASLVTDREIKVELKNANYQTVDSLLLRVDNSGRFYGKFQIPAEGLMGTYRLKTDFGMQTIEVAEYKTPSFYISLKKEAVTDNCINYIGTVSTYSGVPLAEMEVSYNILYHPGFRHFGYMQKEGFFNDRTTTDQNGEFRISLPLSNLNRKEYDGIFALMAEASSPTGEMVQSPLSFFTLVDSYSVDSDIPDVVCVDEKSLSFRVSLRDLTGAAVEKPVCYSISDSQNHIMESGEFISPAFSLDTSLLPSGKYKFTFFARHELCDTLTVDVVLYRRSDSVPPYSTALWVPETRIVSSSGQKTLIPFGSSYDGQYILCHWVSTSGKESYKWIKSNGRNDCLEIEPPGDNERTYVSFIAFRNHESNFKQVCVVPQSQTQKLKIRTETFRDNIQPGSEEKWKFVLEKGNEPVAGDAFALLYDKSLDAIAPLRWSTRLFQPSYSNSVSFEIQGKYLLQDAFMRPGPSLPYIRLNDFAFNTYGHLLFGYGNRVFARAMNNASAKMSSKATANDIADTREEVYLESAVEAQAGAAEEGLQSSRDLELRPIELPVAFFKPDLFTNDNGEIEIEFTVPDFNTTWKFALGAYDSCLNSTFLSLETVASKRIMVKMNPPRFIRTGDKISFTSTIYNNSDDSCPINGIFEIFNPVSNAILARNSETYSGMSPFGSKIINIEFDCPDDIDAVGLRVYASSESGKDGEQTVIPVLPSSQPIIESQQFFLSPGENSTVIRIPSQSSSQSSTFKYCDNPLWQVVTALPPIFEPQYNDVTSLVSALYANAIGSGIISNSPNLKRGLEIITSGQNGDSLLVGNLMKDASLKTVALDNTPWVNNAESETIRLAKLHTLLNQTETIANIESLWEKILSYNNADGGWSWCKDMKSSPMITQTILQNLGKLKKQNYLPKLRNLNKVCENALSYLEKEYVRDYNAIKGEKNGFYNRLATYLYIVDCFPGHKSSPSMKRISEECLAYYECQWKTIGDLASKAMIAEILWNNNYKSVAKEILSSIRQFASESAAKGIWFDNLDINLNPKTSLSVTARILSAFNAINPTDPTVDGIRQWLLLQGQTQDWGNGIRCIDVIDAVLTTGSSWDGNYPLPELEIDGKKMDVSEFTALTGELTLNLDLRNLKGEEIKITRFSPTPAWGGIISQKISPMKDVKRVNTADLSVEKQIWKISGETEGIKVEAAENLSLGDRVRITLIVDCRRNLEFVALTDERPACFEPLAQLSGYRNFDTMWGYMDSGKSTTSVFFEEMHRGRHIISYEGYLGAEGDFSSGICTLQCLYAPTGVAHSAGEILTVR